MTSLSASTDASLDSTGWDSHYVSRYFLKRSPGRCKRHKPWVKSTLVCDNRTHLVIAVVFGRGPSNDATFFPDTIRQAVARWKPERLLADASHDAEPFHSLCRDELQIPKTVIPINPRSTSPGYVPRTRYRREMALKFPVRIYRQRNHVECVMSQIKRVLSPFLNARSPAARRREAMMKILTFNTMLLSA